MRPSIEAVGTLWKSSKGEFGSLSQSLCDGDLWIKLNRGALAQCELNFYAGDEWMRSAVRVVDVYHSAPFRMER